MRHDWINTPTDTACDRCGKRIGEWIGDYATADSRDGGTDCPGRGDVFDWMGPDHQIVKG